MVDAPDPETYHGHDGVRSWFTDFFGPWAAIHVEAEDIKESGQWTVALLHTSVRGEASGGDMDVWGELLDPDALLRNPDGLPEPGPHLGREAVVQQMVDVRDVPLHGPQAKNRWSGVVLGSRGSPRIRGAA